MLEKSTEEFVADAAALIEGAINDDAFVKIHSKSGTAVLISEAEWNIVRDALKMVLQNA